jgi:hypothetical protein
VVVLTYTFLYTSSAETWSLVGIFLRVRVAQFNKSNCFDAWNRSSQCYQDQFVSASDWNSDPTVRSFIPSRNLSCSRLQGRSTS